MNYSHYSQADVDLGDQFEADILPRLEEHYGPLRRNSEQNRNSTFDFSNDKVFVEVKRRRNTKHKYPTTMVGGKQGERGVAITSTGIQGGVCVWFYGCHLYLGAEPGRIRRPSWWQMGSWHSRNKILLLCPHKISQRYYKCHTRPHTSLPGGSIWTRIARSIPISQ